MSASMENTRVQFHRIQIGSSFFFIIIIIYIRSQNKSISMEANLISINYSLAPLECLVNL